MMSSSLGSAKTLLRDFHFSAIHCDRSVSTLMRGMFTCVWWQVTLRCDPIWQVTPDSSEMLFALYLLIL